MDNLEQALAAMDAKKSESNANQGNEGLIAFLDKQQAQQQTEQTEGVTEGVTEEQQAEQQQAEDVTEGAEAVEQQEAEEVEVQENAEAPNTEESEGVTADEGEFILDLEEGLQPDDFVVKHSEKLQELGFEAKSADEFFEKVKSLTSELTEAKTQVETVFANPMLKEANELARQGGDWQQFLAISEVDYDGIPDSSLVLYDVKANMGEQEANDFVEGLTEEQLKVYATKVRNELKRGQEAKKQEIKAKAQEYQQWFDNGIEQAVKSVSVVGGVKVPEQSRTKIAKMLTSFNPKTNATEFNTKYFLNEKGQPDFKKMSEVAYKLELFDAVVDAAKKKAKVEGKKELIKTVSNVQPPQQRNMADATPKKELTYIESLKAGKVQRL